MKNDTQTAMEALRGLEFQFSKLSDKDWTATFEIIRTALQSKPVDAGFPIMALKDAALMLERTPTKGGVTELGAQNCRKAIIQLQEIDK